MRDKAANLERALTGVVVAILLAHVGYSIHMASANHRPAPPPDEPDRYIDISGCPEDFAISEAGSEHSKIPSKYLLAGQWEYRGAWDISGYVTMKDVVAGSNAIKFDVPWWGGTCVFKLLVTGIVEGEPFVVLGPCLGEVNVPMRFSANLVDPTSRMAEANPFEIIVHNGGDIQVRQRQADGSMSPADFMCAGELVHGSFTELSPLECGNPFDLTFLSPGEYGVEVIWKMRSPPANYPAVEVSRATTRFQILPSCDPAPSCLLSESTIADVPNTAYGFSRCVDGQPEPFVCLGAIESEIRASVPGISASDLAEARADIVECVRAHEEDHIEYAEDNVSGELCAGCCPKNILAFPPSLFGGDEDLSRAHLQASECRAYNLEAECYDDIDTSELSAAVLAAVNAFADNARMRIQQLECP